jgi:uncharacterized protein (TIGR02594 family)
MTAQTQPSDAPPWMAIARAELGVHEAPGADNNARIQEYFSATSMGPHTPDSVPWCAAYVGFCLKVAGIEPSGSAAARSYLDWGVPLLSPRVGCIIVFSRPPNPASGHVGFVASLPTSDRVDVSQGVYVLGGNQGDRVCIAPYPVSRIIGWRWPSEQG